MTSYIKESYNGLLFYVLVREFLLTSAGLASIVVCRDYLEHYVGLRRLTGEWVKS